MYKKLRKLIKLLTSRVLIIAFLILIQIAIMIITINYLSEYYTVIQFIFQLLNIAVILFIINKRDNPAYKLAWIIPMVMFPIPSTILYIMLGGNRSTVKFISQLHSVAVETKNSLTQEESISQELSTISSNSSKQSYYINKTAGFPVYKDTYTEYYPTGESFFEAIILELKKAKQYIFIEFFIIEEGVMWDTILSILKQKVQEGVDVRVLYDDMGCLFTLPPKYYEEVRKSGIKCVVFNKFMPLVSIRHNHRDHRKIVVIDGHTGFTGGCNLADEYINGYEKHGKWKDCMVMLRGSAVYTLNVMFLQTWKYYSKEDYEEDIDLKKYNVCVVDKDIYKQIQSSQSGFVQPYGDSPVDGELVGQSVYLNMINSAKKYIYITTPYFVVGDEVITALTVASKSGVDIKIILPYIPDKAYVHTITRSHYNELIEAGIEVYEYTPGFIHSKTVVVDDQVCTIGTINFDYRSLYLHFECGVWMYKTDTVMQVKKDFIDTMKDCKQIKDEDLKNTKWIVHFARSILKIFSPLM